MQASAEAIAQAVASASNANAQAEASASATSLSSAIATALSSVDVQVSSQGEGLRTYQQTRVLPGSKLRRIDKNCHCNGKPLALKLLCSMEMIIVRRNMQPKQRRAGGMKQNTFRLLSSSSCLHDTETSGQQGSIVGTWTNTDGTC